MADHLVIIKGNGSCEPTRLGKIVPGKDTISFFSEVTGIAVICIDRRDVFGVHQFEVPSGATIKLPVRDDATPGFFTFSYCGALTGEDQSTIGWGGDGQVIGGPGIRRSRGDGRVIGGPD